MSCFLKPKPVSGEFFGMKVAFNMSFSHKSFKEKFSPIPSTKLPL